MKKFEFVVSCALQTLSLAAVVLLVQGCSGKKAQTAEHQVTVTVVEARPVGSGSWHEYVGTVEEHEGTSLSFEVPGCVHTLRADVGDRVRKGQLLATVDPTQLRDAHTATVATLHQAQDAYNRFKPLHEQGVLSDIKWVDVQTRLDQAQSAERIARTQLQRTSLTAPFSGVVSARTAERGMNVLAGQQIFKLSDISKVDIKISVPESDLSHISVGMRARVVVEAVGNATLDATVSEKGIEADPVAHTYKVKLTVSGTNTRLMPGMVCNVMLSGTGTSVAQNVSADGIVVPIDAVKLDTDNRRFVWLAVGGKAKQQYITVGGFVEGGVTVTAGMRAGDLVITDGSQKVSQGMTVKTRN